MNPGRRQADARTTGVVLALILVSTIASAQVITLRRARTYRAARIGLNLASGGRQGSLLKNLIVENPGMQPTQTAAIVSADAKKTNSRNQFTSGDPWTGIPVNFYAGGTFQVLCRGNSAPGGKVQICTGGNGPKVWSDVPGSAGSLGCHGTIVSNTAADAHSGVGATFTISPACPKAFAQNATILVRAPLRTTSSAALACGNNCWGWNPTVTGAGRIVIDTDKADFPPLPWRGAQVVELDTSGSYFSTAGVGALYGDLGPDYFFAGQYTQSIRVKVISGTGLSMTFSGSRSGPGARWRRTIPIPPGPGWHTVSGTFTVADPESPFHIGAGIMNIWFVLGGRGKVLIYDPSLISAGDRDQKDIYRASSQKQIEALDPGDCRYWGGAAINASTLDNWISPDFSRMPAEVNVANSPRTGAASPPTGLDEFLNAAKQSGCQSIQIVAPVTMPWSSTDKSDNNVQNLVEYLNGPASTMLGHRRIANGGPSGPGGWSSKFDRIDISYGNEVWNPAAGEESMPMYTCTSGASCWAYSLLASQWCGAAHASPYWKSNDDCGATMQTGNAFWIHTLKSRDKFGKTDSVELNGYTMQRKITDCTVPNFWLAAQTEAVWANNHDPRGDTGFYSSVREAERDGYHVVIYEYQNSTVNNMNCSQAQLDGYANGLGYGVIDAVQALEGEQELGVTNWNFFTIYQRWFGADSTGGAKHAWVWGIIPQAAPSAWQNPRPSYYAIRMVNHCIGNSETAYPVLWASNPTYDFAALDGVTAERNVPYLYAYEFANESTRCLVIANLDPVKGYTVHVRGTDAPSGQVTQVELTGSSLQANNDDRNAASVLPRRSELTNPSGFAIPTHSIVTETWTIGSPPGR